MLNLVAAAAIVCMQPVSPSVTYLGCDTYVPQAQERADAPSSEPNMQVTVIEKKNKKTGRWETELRYSTRPKAREFRTKKQESPYARQLRQARESWQDYLRHQGWY